MTTDTAYRATAADVLRRQRMLGIGADRITRQNRERRATPVWAWYYRWYNRHKGRVTMGTLDPARVSRPVVRAGVVILDLQTADQYVTAAELALYASGAYLEEMPAPVARRTRPAAKRLDPDTVERVRARLAEAGYGYDAPPAGRLRGAQAALAKELDVTIAALSRIRRGHRHSPELIERRRRDTAWLATQAQTQQEVAP